jgi:hypothetical protein
MHTMVEFSPVSQEDAPGRINTRNLAAVIGSSLILSLAGSFDLLNELPTRSSLAAAIVNHHHRRHHHRKSAHHPQPPAINCEPGNVYHPDVKLCRPTPPNTIGECSSEAHWVPADNACEPNTLAPLPS